MLSKQWVDISFIHSFITWWRLSRKAWRVFCQHKPSSIIGCHCRQGIVPSHSAFYLQDLPTFLQKRTWGSFSSVKTWKFNGTNELGSLKCKTTIEGIKNAMIPKTQGQKRWWSFLVNLSLSLWLNRTKLQNLCYFAKYMRL